MNPTMIGVDIAKSVFQVHGEDASGKVLLRKRLGRAAFEKFMATLPAAAVGIEACGSSHHWARRLRALGHEVRLVPASYVKPFVKRNKTDARDAAAICEAMQRPDMRFVAVKSLDQQASRGLQTSRDLLIKQRTQLRNAFRAQMAEFGIIAAQGRRGLAELAARLAGDDPMLPAAIRLALRQLHDQAAALDVAIEALERAIVASAKADPVMKRLTTIPGIGALGAHAIVTAIGDGAQFRCGRDFAAWVGLTPRERQSANTRRRGGISRQGDRGVRRVLVLGASALIKARRQRPERATAWQSGILARRPVKVAVVAQAAKNARTAWAMLRSGEAYRGVAA